METVKTSKPRRPRRSKADIESAIQKAAISQIKRKGFARALVTDIVKRARIEPIVFYNRFKNLNEFYGSFVKRYDYWVSDLLHGFNSDITTPQGYAKALDSLVKALMGDGLMAELLRWEVAEGNEITERTAKLREIDFNSMLEKLGKNATPTQNDVMTISAIIVAGIYFLVLHKDRSHFAGIDLNTPEGRDRLSNAFQQIAKMVYADTNPIETRRKKLEECLLSEGL